MEIINIFAIIKDSLLAVQFDFEQSDEFSVLFNKWNDVEFLEKFFEEHKEDLNSGFYGEVTIEEAVFRTIEEANKFEIYIKDIANRGKRNPNSTLQDLVFTPLSKSDTSIGHLKTKAYGNEDKTWLRVYAIEIASNLYIVSGGAIKLTETMNQREHLLLELKKLNATIEYLNEIGFETKEDYEFIEISYHEK